MLDSPLFPMCNCTSGIHSHDRGYGSKLQPSAKRAPSLRGAKRRSNPCFVSWRDGLLRRSLSSGAHSRDPLARNDAVLYFFAFRFFAVFLFFAAFFGTFLPLARASESPIAIACLRLLTFLPERPLFKVPALRFFIARLTLAAAPLEYFRAMTFLPVVT